jgi:hypothetical protein
MEDFKYYVIADSVQIIHSIEITEVSKPKLFCVYNSLSLKFMLQFGNGMDNSTKYITAVFQLTASYLNRLYVLIIFPDTKVVQVLT